MTNFYQSSLRIHILKDIYKRSTFEVNFCGQKYIGQMKQKSKLGISGQWYMIHGVNMETITTYDQTFAEQLKRLQRDFGRHRNDIMFQVGIVNIFDDQTTNYYKDDTHVQANKEKRISLQKNMKTRYNLQPTIREHMPEATVILDLTGTDTDRIQHYSESGKRYLNKGKKADLEMSIATKEEWDIFYHIRYTTAFDKGFRVISIQEFENLRDFCISENKGKLFLAKKSAEIVSGSLCLLDNKNMIYLYGATDRNFGDIGAHYWLTNHICIWGQEQSYQSLDLLGIAPLGYPHHHLAGVSRFKQAFGGTTLSYVGNFDLVFNKMLYKGFQWIKR